MSEEISVASIPEESLVDDVRAVEPVSAEELAQGIIDGTNSGRTVDNGDDGHATETRQNAPETGRTDSRGNQIRAALKSQREQIFKDLGATEQEIREMLRNQRAQEMAKNDPEISVKAANEILKAREGQRVDRSQEIARDIATLREDGWTDEELQALAVDEGVLNDMRNGKTSRQAARAYEKAQRTTQRQQKRAVPTVKGGSSANVGDYNSYISGMSDAQFREFQERVHGIQSSGRPVKF